LHKIITRFFYLPFLSRISAQKRFFILVLLLLFLTALGCTRGGVGFNPPSTIAPQWKNDWSRGAIFYEVFVRSFKDSNGDGIGDLRGLISKLDYLNDGDIASTHDLGVDVIWLMPIFKSSSYHGYDTIDYRSINADYGTNQDFALLLREAHRRGIRVIIDYVINHTGSAHPLFVNSASSPKAEKRNWYIWRADDPGWTQPWDAEFSTWHPLHGAWFYGIFWAGMPDLNYQNAAVRKEMNSIASYWLAQGVDGFRLDAARYLFEDGPGEGQADTPETHAFWRDFSTNIRNEKPESVLVAENWADTPIIATYFGSTTQVAGGDELPMNFNFPLSAAILRGLQTQNALPIVSKLAEINQLYPPGVSDAPFLTNHDMVRLATQLQNNSGRIRNAAGILLTLPGAPFFYYGEEVGLLNGPTAGDESKRTPMPWDGSTEGGFTSGTPWFPLAPGNSETNIASQTSNPSSLLSHYRNLIYARKSSEALSTGSLVMLTTASGNPPVLAFLRQTATETVLVAHNLSDDFVAAGPYSISAVTAERIYTDGDTLQPSVTSGQWRITLPPHTCGIWRMQ
jgi:alpha-amylase